MARQYDKKKAHNQRDDLTGEHKMGDAGQAVLACLFAVTWIGDSFVFKYTTFLNQYVPLGARIPFGIVILVLSGYLARTGLSVVFGEKREKPGIIRESVFNVVRHPVYLSEILFYLGFLTLNISLAAAVVLAAAIVFMHKISRYEEKLLLARFGEEYRQYMRDVPMWVPRFPKK